MTDNQYDIVKEFIEKKFNKNWKLYIIKETLIEFEDDIKIIENYFRVKQKLYINEFQYILV